jgi:hypothetical protein
METARPPRGSGPGARRLARRLSHAACGQGTLAAWPLVHFWHFTHFWQCEHLWHGTAEVAQGRAAAAWLAEAGEAWSMQQPSRTRQAASAVSEQPAPKRCGATAFMCSSARASGRSTARFDPHTAHAARVCNFWLGGKDHFPADREVGEQVMKLRPQIVAGVRANRCFLSRVVRYLAGCGVRQFLDIGTGIPVPGSTHEIAQEADPRSRVVYVDNDSMVLAHARALLASGPEGSCDYLDADLHDTGYLLREASRTLDFSQPVAVLLLAVLHLIPTSATRAASLRSWSARWHRPAVSRSRT